MNFELIPQSSCDLESWMTPVWAKHFVRQKKPESTLLIHVVIARWNTDLLDLYIIEFLSITDWLVHFVF